jgi:hypothetical protein
MKEYVMVNKTKTYQCQNVHRMIARQDNRLELDSKLEIIEADHLHGKLPRKIRESPKTIHHFNFPLRYLNSKI